MHIGGAKFQEHCLNISREIFYAVFRHFKFKQFYVITEIICIIKKKDISVSKKDISKENAIFRYFLRPFK